MAYLFGYAVSSALFTAGGLMAISNEMDNPCLIGSVFLIIGILGYSILTFLIFK